jgi:hypothetical protein
MLIKNAVIVTLGAIILSIGLLFAFQIITILRKYKLSRPWMWLSGLISFFFLGYVFTALRFVDINLLPNLSLEDLVTAIFFFGAIFVLILAVLNYHLFVDIFGVGISDVKAMKRFASYINLPTSQVSHLIDREYTVQCDVCQKLVRYSIPEVVRAHPHLDRGVIVQEAMGGTNYRLYIRHYCHNEYREIPVKHDSQFEYRSHGPSRPV